MGRRMDPEEARRIVEDRSFVHEMRAVLCDSYTRLADRYTPMPDVEVARRFIRSARMLDAAWIQLGLGAEGQTFEEVARDALSESFDEGEL